MDHLPVRAIDQSSPIARAATYLLVPIVLVAALPLLVPPPGPPGLVA